MSSISFDDWKESKINYLEIAIDHIANATDIDAWTKYIAIESMRYRIGMLVSNKKGDAE